MYEGFASFGGIEVVNSRRAWARSSAARAGWYLRPAPTGLDTALNEDFADPTTAPWYDDALPDVSSRFYGIYGLSFRGTPDSVRSTPLTQNSGDGAVLGAPRRGSRSVVVRVSLIARGRDALEYGQAWLQTIMDTAGCGQSVDCDRADVLFFSQPPTTPEEVVDYSRFLKYAGVTSGPFETATYTSRGIYVAEMEWTWTSERPYVYGPNREIGIELAMDFALIQDAPINWVPYPSAELEEDGPGYTRPILAKNLITNPSLESSSTGWSAAYVDGTGSVASYFTSGRVDDGGTWVYRARMAGNGSTSASGVAAAIIYSPFADLTSVPADRYLQASIWAKSLKLAGGDDVLVEDPGAFLVFYNSSDAVVGSTVAMPADARGNDVYTSAKVEVPATATKARIEVSCWMFWKSGNSDANNGDLRLYADYATISELGSA